VFRVSALIIALVLLAAGSARAAEPRLGEFVFDGGVRAIARGADGSLYVGGEFSSPLKPTGGGLVLAGSGAGTPDPSSFPLVHGTVYAVAADGAGGWYVGGLFGRVGNVDVRNLAHVTAFGTADPGFTPNPDDVVYALARSGGTLYAGGDFASIAGQGRSRLAALDAASGTALPWAGGANAAVFALAVSGGTLYAGGNFTSVGSQAREGIVAVDATTGAVETGWNSQSTGAPRSIVVVGSKVYVAGAVFRFPGGVERRWLAALDATTGAVQSWNPDIGYARGLAASGTTLYAVGDFSGAGVTTNRYTAAFDIVSGLKTTWDAKVESGGGLTSVAVSGSTVYLGGLFSRVRGQDRRNLAAVDASSGALLSWNPQAAGQVNALAAQGTSVYAGGAFAGAGPAVGDAYGVARIRPDGTLDTGFKTGVDSFVTAVLVNGSTVYLAGAFTRIGGVERLGFAAVSAATGGVTSWDPAVDLGDSGPMPYGTALASAGSTLYVAGSFYNVQGNGRRGFAAFDMNSGALIGADVNTVGYINALATAGSTVFVGGSFPTIGGKPRSGVAALQSAGTDVIPWDASVGYNQVVNAIALDGQTAYIGGRIDAVGGKLRRGIGAVDTTTGAASAWDPSSNATEVYGVAVAGGTVFASGDFTFIGGRPRRLLAALDATTGAATAWDGAPDDAPMVLFSDGANVYAGGYFMSVGRRLTGPFAKLDLTAPETTINSSAGGSIAFSADEPDVSFECSVDSGAFAPCSSPYGLAAPHTFAVRATDLSKTTDASPATVSLGSTAPPPDPPVVTPQPVPPVITAPAPKRAPKPKRPSRSVSIPFKGGYRIGNLPRTRACNGKITLELRKGKRVLERRSTRLNKRCRYTTTFKVKRTTLGKARQLTVVVRFHGNRYLGRTTNRFPVLVPR
jgi:hypothetical protein